jgi:hypothetical protein
MCSYRTPDTIRRSPRQRNATNGIRNKIARSGFTLFEVAISLAIMAFGVISVMLVIPSGVKVQQQARMSMLATAKAIELVHLFSNKIGGERIAEFETPEPWEARPFCYSSTRWDMEHRASRWDGGMIPLPLEIAKRLDSDGDEIQALLASGAYLYYADPKVLPGVDPRYVNAEAPNEATKLIFAVSGYAQNNAMPIFPWKAWPYRAAYPSPPMAVGLVAGKQMAPQPATAAWSSLFPGSNWNSLEGWTNGNPDPSRPQDRDPLMNDLFQAFAGYYLGLKSLDVPATERLDFVPATPPSLIDLRTRLVDAVIAFCKNKFNGSPIGMPGEYSTYYNPPASTTDYQGLAKAFASDFRTLCRAAEPRPGMPYDAGKAGERAKIALRVQCMRFLAFAAGTFYLKRVTSSATGVTEREPDLTKAFIDGTVLTVDRLRYYQDCCKESAMLYAASFPYDWGAPRPITRCIMNDYPLIEFDLFNWRTKPIAGGGTTATMWMPVSAQSITSIGLPGIFPGVLTYSGPSATWNGAESPFRTNAEPRDLRGPGHPFWGDAAHFTLTRPFQAAERCRQLIFWSVDWHAYEDAETAPGAPMDASRIGRHGPSMNDLNNSRIFVPGASWDALHLRNPERVLQFKQNMAAYPTGQAILKGSTPSTVGLDDGDGNITVLTGQYGADRNHNYRLDRGPLPKSVRQRAQLIARFQFYDPRIPVLLR